jgi:hypothetical protein
MDLTSFDNALQAKLKEVFSNVVNASDTKALEYSEDGTAQVQLPLISYWRISNMISDPFKSQTAVLRGRSIRDIDDSTKLMFKELSMNLSYQIDIWSDRRHEVDEILLELLLYFHEEPYLTVNESNMTTPYDLSFRVTDISTDIDLDSFSDRGNLYRQIITIEVDNAVMVFPKAAKKVHNIPLRYVEFRKGDDFNV